MPAYFQSPAFSPMHSDEQIITDKRVQMYYLDELQLVLLKIVLTFATLRPMQPRYVQNDGWCQKSSHTDPHYSLPICAMSRFYRAEHTLPLKVTTFRFRSLYFELPSFSCHRLSVSCAVAILSPILASNSYFSHAAAFSIHCTFCRQ